MSVASPRLGHGSSTGTFRLGHLALEARLGDPSHAAALGLLFRNEVHAEPEPRADGRLEMVEHDAGDWPDVPADGLVADEGPAGLIVATEVVFATLRRDPTPWSLIVRTRQAQVADHVFRVHLSVVLHRLLLELGYLYLHAAAVSIRGRTHVFIGEKGAGKSTLSLALARMGGTVLADDHVLLQRGEPRYLVSGCEATSRVTAETEAYVFPIPLPLPARDFAGTPKKELLIGDHFAAAPYEAHTIDAVYFPIVGARLRLDRLSPQQATLDLLARTRRSFRPQGRGDVTALLDFWSGLCESAPAFALELPPNLERLDGLPALLFA